MKVDIRIPISIHRTHNRNRSLSFINSDQQVNVNKGSRQIKPVTLGKRLALMIGHQVTPRCLSTVKGDSSRLVYEVTLGKPPWSLVVRGVKTLSYILSPLAISD